jgi:hypothetical protein
MGKLENRMNIIDELFKHPYLGKSFKKLKTDDMALINNWVRDNIKLNGDELQLSSVRMFMDKSDKPKRWTSIMELASCIAHQVKVTEDKI